MKRLIFSLAVILAILFSISQSQAIPPISQLGHQSWGAPAQRIAAKIGVTKDTVFVGAGNQVHVFEVNHVTPNSPSELTGLNFTVPGLVSALAVSSLNSVLLVGHSEGLHIRNYKTTTEYNAPLQLASLPISDVVTDLEGDTAYVGIAMMDSGYKIINLVNLGTVTVIGGDTTAGITVNALTYRSDGTGGDTLFVAGGSTSWCTPVRVYNVTNPAATSEITIQTAAFNNYSDIEVTGDSIYVAESNYGFRAFYRFSSGPFTVGSGKSIPSVGANFIVSSGDTMLITSSSDGFRIWDDSSKQQTAGPVSIDGIGPAQIIKTNYSTGSGVIAYVSFQQKGFQIYGISTKASNYRVGTGILTGDYVYDIVGDDRNYAYIANGVNGVQIINLTNHSLVSSYLFYQSAESYKKVLIHENTLVMFWDNGFNVVDVTNPASPQLRGTYTTGISGVNDADTRLGVGASDTLIVVIGDNQGIKMFNIQNAANITQMGSTITLPGGCNRIQFANLRINSSPVMYPLQLLAAPGYGNIARWGIGIGGSLGFSDSTTGLPPGKFTANRDFIYFISGDSIKKISSWVFADRNNFYGISGAGGLSGISVSGNFLHVGTSNNRMYVIDTTTKTVKDTFTINDTPSQLKINGLNLLIAANGDGYYHLSDPYGAARMRMIRASGMPKDTVTLPVRVLDGLSGLGALSFEMHFSYDSNYVKFVSAQRGPGLPSTDSILTSVTSGFFGPYRYDTLKIVRADTGEISGPSIAGKDTLLKIKFRIKDNAPVQPLVQSVLINSNRMLLSEGFPVTDFKPGRIYIAPRFGDANQNGAVSAADASYILQSVIGLVGPPPMVLADVSNNGEIRAYDAALILKRLVNPAFKYPVETYYGLKQASAPVNKDIRVMVTTENSSSESDKTAEVNANSIVYEISMKNIKEVWSAEMIIDLGKGQKYTGYKLSSLSDRMTVQSRQEGTLLYLGMAGGEAITKDGLLLQIICQVTDVEQVKPVDIQQFILNESLIENIEGSLSGIPKTYALGQNYPNPFNPVTEIKYQLPNAGKVTLTIYNILGQQVKTLVNATQPAGYFSIRWNGRDDAGISVASGVYFYRIKAGSFIKTKKMMFMK